MNKLIRFIKYFKEIFKLEKKLFPCSVIMSITQSISPFIDIILAAKIIESINIDNNIYDLIKYIAIAVLTGFVFNFFNSYLSEMKYNYQEQLFIKENFEIAKKLYSLEINTLDNYSFKNIIHKHNDAQNKLHSAFSQLNEIIQNIISGSITIVVSLYILRPLFIIGFSNTGTTFFEKPIFLLTIILSILCMLIIILFIAIKMNKMNYIVEDKYSELDKIFCYYLNVLGDYKTGKEIRLYEEQQLIIQDASKTLFNDGEKLIRKHSVNTAKSSSIIAILGSLVGFGVYLFIGIKGLLGLFGIGSLVKYCGSFIQIINGSIKLASSFGKLEEIIPLIEYYFKIIETNDNISYGTKELKKIDKIELINVSFKYPDTENYVLKNINLTINSGEHIAIVGRNGSGKTTLIKLLCRFYDVTEGKILINNINIKDYTKNSIIRLYSIVFQDFQIFSLPLYQNVTATEEYSQSQLYSCLYKANLLDRVLRMPNKEKTYVYKNIDNQGVEISGGEAQKLALARALYKNSQIVILDEPTASLDPIAENEMYNNFNSFIDEKMAIYISHRLSSCIFCNQIVVFDRAQLVQIGTHEDLLKEKNDLYYKMWTAQSKYYN